ncbi:gamma-glutamylcyclotransferase family protein [Halorubrum cibi]|uniref:Gamma-glutamyl cyclotransferase, AIG2-like n=1 Tax=Halorubrum cibi TaxID=413815 RepID=A0A521AVP3_9EURY|nr:gamma-glutamylcyclotransferase family protein [Halorubrum cibi]SMO38908.1 Gamma-glutamyl cyclotransferase, AIG2-like [Halorubrum cibi]
MDVFVYGTLTEPDRVGELLDSFVFVGSATLSGLRPVEGRYPTLAPGGETAGRLLRTDEVGTLDAYEGVEDGLYVRVTAPLDAPDGFPEEATVYVGDPRRLGADATWPGQGEFRERVKRYLDRTDVAVRLDSSSPV